MSLDDDVRKRIAEDKERWLQIEKRKDKARAAVKAPESMFAIYVWDPSNPEKSIPSRVGEPYEDLGKANEELVRLARETEEEYANMNPRTRICIGEIAYFVVDDKGIMV